MTIVQSQGQVINIPQVDELIKNLVGQWIKTQPDVALKWWQVWSKQINFKNATKFLIGCIDDLIHLVEQYIPRGVDKKATVLAAISMLYDFVVANALPIYFKPFASKIKDALVFIVISELIDFIVAKYREGSWQTPGNPEEAHAGGQISGGADAAIS